ncbi:ubiquitin-conjugating enzyme [Capsaspora owczarzaki ATCC 30864]|uniref:Ubiquitin-conjugating enzyme n=1 Tax=Capsaspora owczarzaki (strain ATCC 30864) TaxID=595528 RepID=A0A0D2WLJ7_CAPO3|nr:ubiquitin-conjugating enzyme [Capsaspora owczarzaki ATCC 30864]KJE90758.1 ubiquitin-conjugating enzyme [Capsaspora owczarzaki ATCC 30864]|eukprot:XP_004348763.2 ubiquitin-conjugating enzyme [Capsaspora owczarzaki ATCC 30864]
MSMTVQKRLMRELAEVERNAAAEFDLGSSEDNLLVWTAVLRPPAPSLYQGGVFHVSIRVPNTYPMTPPAVKFSTRICHPNIHWKSGDVCLDILKTAWSPAWTLRTLCLALLVLLDNPEVDSPLNCDAGNLLRCGDKRGYKSLVTMLTALHATPASASSSPN